MSVQDLSCWHDRRTVDNAHGRSGYLSFQQFDRATDRAEAPASVTDGAAIPSARQLGSSTDSRSEPFKGWLLLSQPPGCLSVPTSFPTEHEFGDLSCRSRRFPCRDCTFAADVRLRRSG